MPSRLFFNERVLNEPPLINEVVPLTIGYAPPDPLFVRGRYGGSVDSLLDRIFLFGEPKDPSDVVAKRGDGLITGQERDPYQPLQGFVIRVSGQEHSTYSREVVMAVSKGHLDVTAVEAMAQSLRLLAQKKPDELGDAAVTLQQILSGLLSFPTVGYRINPPIALDRNDYVEIRGIPEGMRIYLTGYYRRDAR